MGQMCSGLFLRLEQGKLSKNYQTQLSKSTKLFSFSININRQKDQKIALDQLTINHDYNKKKIDEHDFQIQKIQKRTASFEELQKKIHEIDTERKILESKLSQEISNIRNHTDLLREKIRVSSQDIEQFDKQTGVIQDEVRRYQEALIDYKEKLNKTVTGIHQDLTVSLNGMKIKVDAISGIELHFTAHVKHLEDELKKIDLNYEQEKLHNSRTIQRFIKKVNKVKNFTATSATQIKEFENLIKTYEKKITVNSQVSTLLQNYMQSTDKYLGLFLPVQIMNQVSEAMHASIEGKPYNKLIFYEQAKYQELESLINQNDLSKFSKDTYKIPVIPDFVEELQNLGQQVYRQPELQMQTIKSGGHDINSNNQGKSFVDQNSKESHANKDDNFSDHMSQNKYQTRYPKSQIQDYEEQSIADRKGSANRNNRRVSYYNDKYGVKPDNYTEVPANKMPNDTISEGEKTQSNFSLYNQKFRLDQPKNNTAAKVGQFLNQHLSDAPSTRMRISRKPKVQAKSVVSQQAHQQEETPGESEARTSRNVDRQQIQQINNDLPKSSVSHSKVSSIKIEDQNDSNLKIQKQDSQYLQPPQINLVYQQEKESTPTSNLLHKNESLISSGTQTAKANQNIQDFSNRASIQINSQLIPRKSILQLSNDQENQQLIQEEQSSNSSNSSSPKRKRKSIQRLKEDSQQVQMPPSLHSISNIDSNQGQAYGNTSIIQTRNSVVTNQTFDYNSQRNIDSNSAQPTAPQINSNIQSYRAAPDLGQILSDEDFINRLKELFQPMIDDSIQEIAEQIDQNMDFLEQKFKVFNRAIEMQATSFEEQLDIKEKDIYQAIEDFRVSLESELKRRARSNNDMMIENRAIALYGRENDDLHNKSVSNKNQKADAATSPEHTQKIILDQNCVSCSGQHQQLVKALKLACLHYKSSEVNYKQIQMPRKSLINLNKQMIQESHQKLQQQELTLKMIGDQNIDEVLRTTNPFQRYTKNSKLNRDDATPSSISKDNQSLMGLKFSVQNTAKHTQGQTKDFNQIDTQYLNLGGRQHNISHLEAMTSGIINDQDLSLISVTKHSKNFTKLPGTAATGQTRNITRDPYDMMSVRFQTAAGQYRDQHNFSGLLPNQSFNSSSRINHDEVRAHQIQTANPDQSHRNNIYSSQSGSTNYAQNNNLLTNTQTNGFGTGAKIVVNQGLMKTEYSGFFNTQSENMMKRRKTILEQRNISTGRQILQNQKLHSINFQKTPDKSQKGFNLHNQSMDQIIVEGRNKLNSHNIANLPNIKPSIIGGHKSLKNKKNLDGSTNL
eukprot:403370792